MSLPATARRLAALALYLYAVSGCGGERIRLGDGPIEGSAKGGHAGVSSTSAGTDGVGGSGGAGGRGDIAVGGSAAAGATSACPDSDILASEVLFIGDSWAVAPRVGVGEYAHQAQTIESNEDFASLALAGASMADIAQQYATRQSGATKVKVLLMDGGTWDPIAAQMANGSVPEAIDNALSEFEDFLSQVARDGTVEQIVYFLVPPLPNIPGVDTMRDPLGESCRTSSVPCHFIDLGDSWTHSEYTAANGYLPSDSGAEHIAALIWAVMQAECIAQ